MSASKTVLGAAFAVALATLPGSSAEPISANSRVETLRVAGHFEVGPNVGRDHRLHAPIDVMWDESGRKLHARSLILTEVDDPVDLRFRRAPGKYPDGPLSGTSPAGALPGLICWDALTSEGWRQLAGIEGMAKDSPAAPPTAGSHPGWLTFWTYAENHDDRIRRVILDDTGAMSLGGGGFGGEGLPVPAYGFHLFGGGLRVQEVASPAAPSVRAVGGGDTRYEYRLVACDSKGHETPPGPPAVVSGPATLDGEHYVHLEWDQVTGAETYGIIRNGSRLDIRFRGEGKVKQFDDKGLPAQRCKPASRNTTADAEIDGALTAKQALHTPGLCSAEIETDRHDFDPPCFGACTTLAVTARKPVRVTGLIAPTVEGRWLILVNTGQAAVTLADEDEHSQATNRFRTGTGRAFVLQPEQACGLIHTVGRWRFLVSPAADAGKPD